VASAAETQVRLPDADLDPVGHAVAAAMAKARDIGRDFPECLVIGADTLVFTDGKAFGKPRDPAEARAMLAELTGRDHFVVTGLAVGRPGEGRWTAGHEVTRVWMRRACSAEIDDYVRTGEPMDKAGAYAIQGKGATLVERIEGCYFAVVGLPLARLALMLREYGVTVLGAGTGGSGVNGTGAVQPDHQGSAPG
jgi:septum formation protein